MSEIKIGVVGTGKSNRVMCVAADDWEKLRSERDELKPWAELGKLAAKAHICDYKFNSPECKETNGPWWDDFNKCHNFDFCQKRKELKGVEQDV